MMGQKRIKHRPGDIVNKGDLQAVMKNISASMKRSFFPLLIPTCRLCDCGDCLSGYFEEDDRYHQRWFYQQEHRYECRDEIWHHLDLDVRTLFYFLFYLRYGVNHCCDEIHRTAQKRNYR